MRSVATKPRKQTPRRRPVSRLKPVRRSRLGWRTKGVLILIALIAAIFAWAAIVRAFAPSGNTTATRFDAIIVLGTPADDDGNPMPAMLASVSEGVREYDRGVAPRLILTGGLDGRAYPEAVVMARVAQAQGVPASAIFIEPDSNDTIQNACYTGRIMKSHGWHSAEVISIPTHIARASIIFSRQPIEWRAHTAPPMQPFSSSDLAFANGLEILKMVRYLVYGQWAESCSP
jgi:uncharacterized SAM-binding protein YcdF (DUF218 family)